VPGIEEFVGKVIQGDCREVMSGMPAESVDLVFADFPFRPRAGGSGLLGWNAALAEQFHRVLKPTGSLYVLNNPLNLAKVLGAYSKFVLRNVPPRHYKYVPFGGRMYAMRHNLLLFFVKDRERYYFDPDCGRVFTDVWDDVHYAVRGRDVGSIPEEIARRSLLASTRPGDVVLDPFAGFGTVAAVAKKLGRRFIGIELDPARCRMARERLARVEPPLEAFGRPGE